MGLIYVVLCNFNMIEIFSIVCKINFKGIIFSNVGVDVLVDKVL